MVGQPAFLVFVPRATIVRPAPLRALTRRDQTILNCVIAREGVAPEDRPFCDILATQARHPIGRQPLGFRAPRPIRGHCPPHQARPVAAGENDSRPRSYSGRSPAKSSAQNLSRHFPALSDHKSFIHNEATSAKTAHFSRRSQVSQEYLFSVDMPNYMINDQSSGTDPVKPDKQSTRHHTLEEGVAP